MDSSVRDESATATLDFRDPYPFFAARRREGGVFHGTVMDYSRTPESLRPADSYAALTYSTVSAALRNDRVFSSKLYDATIGVFMGPTILAMSGTELLAEAERGGITDAKTLAALFFLARRGDLG